MAVIPFSGHADLQRNQVQNFAIELLANDPTGGALFEGRTWIHTGENRLKQFINGGIVSMAFLNDVTAGSITGALWDAQTVVVAVVDDSPAPVIIPEGGFLGRPTGGNIGALTTAAAKALLGIPAGTVASETYVDGRITALVDTAPGALDTLNELAAALGDDPNFATTITDQISAKASKFAADIGDGAATTITVTHNLGTQDVTFSMRPVAGGPAVLAAWEPVSNSAVEVQFNVAPTAGQYRVTIIG